MTYAPFDLSGKTALVTGGNRGIGLGMARALAASNANIAVWGRKDAANASAVEELSTLGTGAVKAWAVDVSDEQAVIDATNDVVADLGRIDSCFANAGVGFGAPSFAEMSTELWRKTMAINMEGAFWTLRESVKHMIERAKAGDPGGSVIGMSSLSAIEGAARNQAYASTKGGLISMIKGIAVEMPAMVSAPIPFFRADRHRHDVHGTDSDVFTTKVISRVPARRWGSPTILAASLSI